MRKWFLLISAFVVTAMVSAQSDGRLDKYRRNSLANLMVYHSEDEFGMSIFEAFQAIPTPDKYDNHSIGWNVIQNSQIKGAKSSGYGLIKAKYGYMLTKEDVERNGKALERVLNESQCAKIMVAKWFGMDVTNPNCNIWNGFNMTLIQQRGQYNASDLDVENALNTVLGLAALSDAGEELLNNTFVLVNDMTYVTAEEKAALAKNVINKIGYAIDKMTFSDIGERISDKGSEWADEFTGFTVKNHSYLFQLVWNDSVLNTFYNDYYVGVPTCKADSDRIVAFWQDKSLFRLKYVAHEFEFDAKTTIKSSYSRDELLKTICAKSINKNIAALQLAYDDFMVKTPIYEIVPGKNGFSIYRVKIGMKEGVKEDAFFQVIQQVWDPKTQSTRYRYVATLVPVPGEIWDNRYNAVMQEGKSSGVSATSFKKVVGGKVLPGMLIVEGNFLKLQRKKLKEAH